MKDWLLQRLYMLQDRTRRSTIHRCLAHRRRRQVLYRLKYTDGSQTLADLAEYVADREADSPVSEIDGETVKNVYMALYHAHVPKLADAGLVQYDQDGDAVELREYPGRPLDEQALASD